MRLLSPICDSDNDSYILFHLAVLVFTITVLIPINFHLTKLPPVAALAFFSMGFISLFMIARNEKTGHGLLKCLGISKDVRQKRWQKQFECIKTNRPDLELQHDDNFATNCTDLVTLLQNFIDDVKKAHGHRLDYVALDSFCQLKSRLLVVNQMERDLA
ncbi:MAG: hypothetical protein ACREBI_04515 [Nitrosotalea sp.]